MNVNMALATYVADRTALLIVDPYNDFMSEGGKLYAPTKETAEASNAPRALAWSSATTSP